MYQFYRIKCSFIYKDGIKVEGRICFEMAQDEEEARQKVTEYLQSWGYTDIEIAECRPETEAEKYQKEPQQPPPDTAAPAVPKEPAVVEDSDELF